MNSDITATAKLLVCLIMIGTATLLAGYMKLAFVTAIVLVYMVLASQFNSFIQPFIIMVAQPR